ncbi:MAG TPA: hypothetical protein VFA57_01580 [Pseudolabrys sp.]|jgi:hypothetical protein|nr:hypothetical protein [Pseudolabrys sp.]
MTRAIVAISGAIPRPFAGLRSLLTAFWHEFTRDRYHPERHYMRGPGPAWHAKHGPSA